jgi:hypothetical protein
MKLLALTALMLFSHQASALTKSELSCLVISTYHEARGESKADWLKVASVAINRKNNPRLYGSKSAHLCDIVKSKQYTSSKRLSSRINDAKSYKAIYATLSQANLPATKLTHFKTRKGVMIYAN